MPGPSWLPQAVPSDLELSSGREGRLSRTLQCEWQPGSREPAEAQGLEPSKARGCWDAPCTPRASLTLRKALRRP